MSLAKTEKAMPKLLLIGGYPKGFRRPFHPSTKSGKILHDILKRNNIKAELIDLWNNKSEEKKGSVLPKKIDAILGYKDNGFTIIALGKYVHNCISRQMKSCTIHYLPHPAARRSEHIRKLESGLKQFAV